MEYLDMDHAQLEQVDGSKRRLAAPVLVVT
jgi:hypothetical protein